MLTGKKILLTGLTGQVGGAFADQLAPHNEVWGLARFSKPGAREKAEAAGVKCVVGDFVTGAFAGLPDDFDVIVHLAANTKPGTPEVGMQQNAIGTGRLMYHCRNSKAFIHTSASGCYLDNPTPGYLYKETDNLGGNTPFAPNYAATKTAAEGVVRTLAILHTIPTTIGRLDVSYGRNYDDGGLPGINLEMVLRGDTIRVPAGGFSVHSPIHEDDMVRHLEVFARAASVPATIVNWGGPIGVPCEEWCRYLGELTGREVSIEYVQGGTPRGHTLDPGFGRSLGMEWLVHWRDGMRQMVEARHPEALVANAGA